MPYLIGSVADGMGLGVDQAGLIGSAELLIVALSAFAISAKVRVLPRRKVALLGGVIAVVGHSLSLLTNSIEALVVCRALAGVGAGMALAIGNACLAASHDPSKAYGQVMMLLATVTAGVIVSLGYITEIWSYYGVFGTQAIVVALMLIPMSFLARRRRDRPEDDVSRGEVPMLPAVLIVVGILLWHFCDNSIWGFSERIGNKIGMEPERHRMAAGWRIVRRRDRWLDRFEHWHALRAHLAGMRGCRNRNGMYLGDHLHRHHPDLHGQHSHLHRQLHVHLVLHLRPRGRVGSPRKSDGRGFRSGQHRRGARTVHQRKADRERGLRGDGEGRHLDAAVVMALSVVVGWHINQKLKAGFLTLRSCELSSL